MVFLELRHGPGVYSRVSAGMAIQNSSFFQLWQDSCLVTKDTPEISSRFGRAIQMLLKVTGETQAPFVVATVILGFLSIFKKSQASSPSLIVNSAFLSRCQRVMRSPVQMR